MDGDGVNPNVVAPNITENNKNSSNQQSSKDNPAYYPINDNTTEKKAILIDTTNIPKVNKVYDANSNNITGTNKFPFDMYGGVKDGKKKTKKTRKITKRRKQKPRKTTKKRR